jgi:peptide/nickel transport system ATP-binding protein
MRNKKTSNQTNNQKRPLLRVSGLKRYFDVSKPLLNRLLEGKPRMILKAVSGIDFELYKGQTFALVGESGCGKSTVAHLVVRLLRPTAGKIEFDGIDVGSVTNRAQMAQLRRRMAMIFQDPYASLNPRWRVAAIVSEPIRAYGLIKEARNISQRTEELLIQVGLSPADGEKYPHEFSGGQRQRISIARALASEPEFIICDEPTSALDVSVQAQILNLMKGLQNQFDLTYLFISHDLAVVKHNKNNISCCFVGLVAKIISSFSDSSAAAGMFI